MRRNPSVADKKKPNPFATVPTTNADTNPFATVLKLSPSLTSKLTPILATIPATNADTNPFAMISKSSLPSTLKLTPILMTIDDSGHLFG